MARSLERRVALISDEGTKLTIQGTEITAHGSAGKETPSFTTVPVIKLDSLPRNNDCPNINIPNNIKNLVVMAVEDDMDKIAREVDFVFSALDMDNEKIKHIEEDY